LQPKNADEGYVFCADVKEQVAGAVKRCRMATALSCSQPRQGNDKHLVRSWNADRSKFANTGNTYSLRR